MLLIPAPCGAAALASASIAGDHQVSVNDDLRMLDMVESPQQVLWFSSGNGINRLRRSDLAAASMSDATPLDYTWFDPAYLVRVRLLVGQLQARLEERQRIERDLHDTLLQSVQGLVMRFHTATQRIAAEQAARSMLAHALDQSDRVMVEARARVSDLRFVSGNHEDLTQAFTMLAEELSLDAPLPFSIIVDGAPRELLPVAREEDFSIGQEAITNVFRHARAQKIEVELAYEESGLTLRVRDDGRGVDAS